MSVLGAASKKLIETCEETKSGGKVQHTKPEEADRLVKLHLNNCAKVGISSGKKISGSASIVGEPEWSKAGIEQYGESQWKATKVDNLNGFVDKKGNVWVHKDRGNSATMIHEAIHKYSDNALIKQSQPLNEGITEYFTRYISNKEGMAKLRRNYQDNYESSKKLAGIVGEKTLCEAYFSGDTEKIKSTLDSKKGKGTWDKYINLTKEGKWKDADSLLE